MLRPFKTICSLTEVSSIKTNIENLRFHGVWNETPARLEQQQTSPSTPHKSG